MVSMEPSAICPICNTGKIVCAPEPASFYTFYACPVCGQYRLYYGDHELRSFNKNHLASFLAYNGFPYSTNEKRCYTTLTQEECEKKELDHADEPEHTHLVPLIPQIIDAWYSKTFAEKVDSILLYLGQHTSHWGDKISLTKEQYYSAFFIDRYDYDEYGNPKARNAIEMNQQAQFMLNYLVSSHYIETSTLHAGETVLLTLQPEGYARVDHLQRSNDNSKDVLVAMQFGKETRELREAIRTGITNAGYHAIFIDEVEHNDQITPELLKHIRMSRFVVVDLSHQNNGAYFEEGYAMGLGKPVIQLCKMDTKLHFDIAQKNTIIWSSENEIPDRLMKRIHASIDSN